MMQNQIRRDLRIQTIGIALAAYRPNPEYFSAQLKSIQDQTFLRWTCYITSDSPLEEIFNSELLEPFRKDPRFVWSENEVRLGHKKNFERAMRLSADTADAVAPSDQDDIWYPEKLETCRAALESGGALSLVHSDMHVLQGATRLSETAWMIEKRGVWNCSPAELLVRNVVAGCGLLIDSELVKRFWVIPHGAEYHDHWFALVAASHGGIFPISTPLYEYRQHGANTVGVTPFPGTFAEITKYRFSALIEKCRATERKSAELFRAADTLHLPLGNLARIIVGSRYDFGLGYFFLGLRAFFSKDRALARACFARAFGKLSFLGLR